MAVCLDYQAVYYRREEEKISWRMKVLLCGSLLFALSFRIWLKIESTDLGYQLAHERAQSVELDMQRREKELELSLLLRPDNLSRRAHNEIGLTALRPSQARKIWK